MARIKFARSIGHKMEGRQVILKVEKVNEELGEILCTPVAVSGEAPFIDLQKDKDYTVTDGPIQPIRTPTEQEVFQKLLQDIQQMEYDMFVRGRK